MESREYVCPMPLEEIDNRRFWHDVASQLCHSEMTFVLPAIQCALPALSKLDCVFRTPGRGAREHGCFIVVSGADMAAATKLLATIAEDIISGDPYETTTINDARSLVGLPPLSLFQRAVRRLIRR